MAIRDIRLPDGSELKLDEWLHWPTYSTIEFAAYSKITLFAFTYTAGQQVPSVGLASRNANDADTNTTVQGRTNHDEAYVAYAITYEAFGLSNADANPATAPGAATKLAGVAPAVSRHNMLALQRDLLVELFVGSNITKPQARSPLSRFSQSVGPVTHGTAAGGTVAVVQGPPVSASFVGGTFAAADVGTQGRVSSNNQWRFELPIYIEADRVFKLRASTPTAVADLNQDIRLRFWLDGMKRRPVA